MKKESARRALGEEPDIKKESGNTYPVSGAVLEEVEGTRGGDDSSIAKRCGVY